MSTVATSITAILTNIFSSASKLVFLMIAFTLCIGLFAGKITQDNFIYLAASVFSYYFGLAVGSVPAPAAPAVHPTAETAPLPATTVTSETKTSSTTPASVPGVK